MISPKFGLIEVGFPDPHGTPDADVLLGMTDEPVVLENVKYWRTPRNDGFIMIPKESEAYKEDCGGFALLLSARKCKEWAAQSMRESTCTQTTKGMQR